MADMINNPEFTRELNDYLRVIEYDANQIQQERNKAIEEILCNEQALEIVSGNKLTK